MLCLLVLSLIQSARLTYGLRTNDYARYHRHATRRIATLHRVTTGNDKGVTGKSKGTASKSSKKSAISHNASSKQIDAEGILKDERLIELLVWETERAWAEGMRGREELAILERNNDKAGLASKRHRSHRRLVKAAEHAEKLVSLLRPLGEQVTASTMVQLEIYSLYMAGTHSFALASSPSFSSSSSSSESSPAREGANKLSTAYVLLEALAKYTERATQEALAFEMLDELEPMIRYCAYKAEMGSSSGSQQSIQRS